MSEQPDAPADPQPEPETAHEPLDLGGEPQVEWFEKSRDPSDVETR